MESIKNLIGQLGPRRLALMGGIAVALLVGLAALAFRTGSPTMGYLFTDLDPSAAQAISEKLQSENVPFRISADGTAVMAPVDKLPELRMSMASQRLGGKIGYEVLDEEQPFGVSASRAKLNETRAIEGELARSIESVQSVSKARVHIVMPERELFAAEGRKATAAVTVKTIGRLPAETVQAIRYLVASSVPELSPESVSIIDQTGALLARAGEAGGAGASDADERQLQVEARLRSEIESMLEPIVGAGKVRAEVSAVVDRDQVREEASVIDPDKQAIQHQVTVESTDQSGENQAGPQQTSVAAQLPEGTGAAGATPGDTRTSAKKENSEDTTYDNSRTNTVTLRSPGKLARLTVAVMVDGGPRGLPAAQIQRLQRLVENAVGFDAERGDSVVVENIPFTAAAEAAAAENSWLSRLPMDKLFGALELLIIGAVGLIAVRMLRPKRPALDASAGTGEVLAIEGSAVPNAEQATPELAGPDGAQLLDQEIALAEVDGRIKLSALKRIGDTIASSPAEAASVIRQWMTT